MFDSLQAKTFNHSINHFRTLNTSKSQSRTVKSKTTINSSIMTCSLHTSVCLSLIYFTNGDETCMALIDLNSMSTTFIVFGDSRKPIILVSRKPIILVTIWKPCFQARKRFLQVNSYKGFVWRSIICSRHKARDSVHKG